MVTDERDPRPSEADDRMARILSEGAASVGQHREQLRRENSDSAEDVLVRLNALDFVNSLVGEATEIPEKLGDYRITGLLGRGGMGTVYQAYQESLEREVALKVLSPSYSADPTMRKRFRSEARATASLHHEHIVPIYDFGETMGLLFFAMERVDGVSLDKHISAARRRSTPAMEPLEAARRFSGVAAALGHAHRRRLLHRDVKPGNILVQADGSLALADFGLSKVLGEVSVHLTTKEGGFLGTLHYAAPEQARGHEVTPASDLYSLGVTMFEAITGRLPLSGESTEAVLQSILYGQATRLRECLPRAPKDLDAVLDKVLSKEPEDRYEDGEILARDLMRVAEGEPVRIRRQPIVVRLWRRAKKNPGLSAAVLTVLILSVVTLVLFRGLLLEASRSEVSRYENLIAQAMDDARNEGGVATGPPGYFEGLTGVPEGSRQASSGMMSLLQEAEALRPEEAEAARLRAAYLDDPLPGATDLLRAGRGFQALQLLDTQISDGAGLRDPETELALYRVYLGRAVANLTRSVSRRQDARLDLVRASFLRPGAFFSNVLLAITEWDPSSGAEQLIGSLNRFLTGAPSGGARAIGGLLLALADIRAPSGANLMEFAMPYRDRKVLHQRALELLTTTPEALAATDRPTGLEAEVAENARSALASLGDQVTLRSFLSAGRDLLDRSVAPDSPLQAWSLVFTFLDGLNPDASFRLPSGDEMSPEMQVRGWAALLGIDPSEGLLQIGAERVASLSTNYENLPGLRRLNAMFQRWVGDGMTAWEAADAWVKEEPDDPDAYLCRMWARLLAGQELLGEEGQLVWVGNDGGWALSEAADPDLVRDDILRLLEEAESLHAEDPATVDEIRNLGRAFGGEGQ